MTDVSVDDDPMFATDAEDRDRKQNAQLTLYVERIERLEEEKKGVADDIRDVYGELKAVGYDPKIVRQLIRLRKMDADDRKEMEAVLDLYKAEVGLS